MNAIFLLRLVLDGVAAGLLLFAFAYFWHGNAPHEWAGAGMFVLLAVHNVFHLRWYASLAKKARDRRAAFNRVLTGVLLAGMLGLLASSLLISETLFAGLRLDDDFLVQRIHAGLAYWLLVIVAAHLGLRWPLLMATSRRLLGPMRASTARTAVLRVVAAGIALQGVSSALALNLRGRLLFQMSLDWWNFEESVAGFFGHCAAVAGLCMFLTYYTALWRQRRERRAAVHTLVPADRRFPGQAATAGPSHRAKKDRT